MESWNRNYEERDRRLKRILEINTRIFGKPELSGNQEQNSETEKLIKESIKLMSKDIKKGSAENKERVKELNQQIWENAKREPRDYDREYFLMNMEYYHMERGKQK